MSQTKSALELYNEWKQMKTSKPLEEYKNYRGHSSYEFTERWWSTKLFGDFDGTEWLVLIPYSNIISVRSGLLNIRSKSLFYKDYSTYQTFTIDELPLEKKMELKQLFLNNSCNNLIFKKTELLEQQWEAVVEALHREINENDGVTSIENQKDFDKIMDSRYSKRMCREVS